MSRTTLTALCLTAVGGLPLALAYAQAPGDKRDKPGAAPPGQMTMPKPPAELDAMYKPFEGSWKCETTFPAGSMGPNLPETKAQSLVSIKKDPSGFWYRGTWELKKTKTMPGMKGEFLLGYAPQAKQGIMLGHDMMGSGSMASGTPQGDGIVFSGEGFMMGQKVKVRETLQKRDDGQVVHKFEADTGRGMQPMGEDVCKK